MTNILETITVLIRNSIVHQWYVSKSESDKRILKLLAGLSLSLICYVGMWVPLNNYVDIQQRQAYLAQSTADWLIANRMALEAVATSAGSGTASPSGNQPTISQITNSAAALKITLSRLQPEADGSVSVALEQQSFNAVAQWLSGIEREQGFTIDRASIDRTSEPGLINAQFRIR